MKTELFGSTSLHILIAAWTCGTILAASTRAQEASYDLRPMWKTGQVSRYRILQMERTTAQMQDAGQPQQSSTRIEVLVNWTVLEAAEGGGGSAQLAIESMTFDVTDSQGQTHRITADSADERFESMRQYIAALSDAPITVTVAADGSITAVTGYEAIRSAAGAAGENLDEGFFKDLARDLAALTGGQAELKPGAKWTHENTSRHPLGELHQKYSDEFRGVELMAGIPVAFVHREGQLTLEPDLSQRPPDGPQLDLHTTEASVTSQMFFDLSRHELAGSHTEQVLALDVTLTVAGRQFTRTIREVTSTQVLRVGEE